jgi:hypothetical protein
MSTSWGGSPSSVPQNARALEPTIQSFKAIDDMIGRHVQPGSIVPVRAGTEPPYHAGVYADGKTPFLEDVSRFEKVLAGTQHMDYVTPLTMQDVEAMKDKAYVATLWDFDRWVVDDVMRSLPLTEPQKKAWLRETYPEFFDRQVEAMKLLEDLQSKYDKLIVTGPESLEDMIFMFFFEKEMRIKHTSSKYAAARDVNLPHGLTSFQTAPTAAWIRSAFERGIWNSRKRFLELFKTFTLDSSQPDYSDGAINTRPYNQPNFATTTGTPTPKYLWGATRTYADRSGIPATGVYGFRGTTAERAMEAVVVAAGGVAAAPPLAPV